MIPTHTLIAALATDVPPVRPLRPPLVRAGFWLLLAALVLGCLAGIQGLRPDLAARLEEPSFVAGLLSALLTGVLAAGAAFAASVPGRSRRWLLLPLPALALWLSTLGDQCLSEWVSLEPDGIGLDETARCFATLALVSAPLSLAMLAMLRYAAPLRPIAAILTGGLAVAAVAAAAVSLLHDIDATAMILAWNLGTVALFLGLAAAFGRRMLSRLGPRPTLPSD